MQEERDQNKLKEHLLVFFCCPFEIGDVCHRPCFLYSSLPLNRANLGCLHQQQGYFSITRLISSLVTKPATKVTPCFVGVVTFVQ